MLIKTVFQIWVESTDQILTKFSIWIQPRTTTLCLIRWWQAVWKVQVLWDLIIKQPLLYTYVRGNPSENFHGYTLFWRFNFIWLICFVICMCFIATFLLLTHYYQDFLKDKFSRTLKFSSEERNWGKKAEQHCKTSILEW